MRKKVLSFALAAGLAAGALAGCGASGNTAPAEAASNDAGAVEETADAEPKPVNTDDMFTVSMAVIGNPQKDLDQVVAKMNEQLGRDLGAQIDVTVLGWGEFAQQIQLMLTGGEKLDLVPVMYTQASNYVNSGYLLDLTDLVEQYGPDIKSAINDDTILHVASMNGITYGLPVEKEWYADSCLVMRKDILDKYNLDVSGIDSLEECEDIFAAVHENEPEMDVIVGASGSLIGNIYFADTLADKLGVLDNGGADSTVVNYFETDNYKNLAGTVRKYYEAGYISKDMPTSTDSGTVIMKAGNAFCFATPYKPGVAEQESLSTGQDLIAVRINPPGAFCYTSAVAALTWGISYNCEDPEITMKVLNYMYSNKDFMNLLNWGIEGVHYKYVDEENDIIGFPDGVDATTAGYNLNMGWELPNQYNMHVWEGSSHEIMDEQKAMNYTATHSKALGFMFDSTNVAAELTALSNVMSEYEASLDCGAVDPEEVLPEFNQKLYAAGLQKVIDEKQRQLDEWLAQQN
ncbi:ABC transporter substrate-binding protein [Lachnoclostridium sp. Marseille-P6806]|uniref:ABC transporter substrate-binding protein n=1 Tax=Lachnoclostridium sp. Marseille-P6806 TaxID=2364793 RepID=UPI00102F7DFC|nr:ABC transporter substrate-binding protein [Lachnoclostridium sp. Marseille-P6806]